MGWDPNLDRFLPKFIFFIPSIVDLVLGRLDEILFFFVNWYRETSTYGYNAHSPSSDGTRSAVFSAVRKEKKESACNLTRLCYNIHDEIQRHE